MLNAKSSLSSSFLISLVESEEYGPVFIREPDDFIFPLFSDEKKVVMHCEARGNPPPTYRWDICLLITVLLSQLISMSFITNVFKSPILLVFFQLVHQWDGSGRRGRLPLQLH